MKKTFILAAMLISFVETNAQKIYAGGDCSFNLCTNGMVGAWGQNVEGSLGTGNTTNTSVPVQTLNLSGITAVSAGERHNLALKSDGTVWGWGMNNYGQLGAAAVIQPVA